MTHFDEEENRLTKVLFALPVLLLISFTVFDILDVFPTVSDSLKLSGIVLCFLYTVSFLFLYNTDSDRVTLMLSMLFAVAADVFLLFTSEYLIGILLFCMVQEFHSIRLLCIHRSIVRMNGRITTSYRNYKIWKALLLQNFIQLLPVAGIVAAGLLLERKDFPIPAAALFYAIGFIWNLVRAFSVSRDVRLLDDMHPLRCYAFGMLLYFICDVLLVIVTLSAYVPFLFVLAEYTKYIRLFIWPFYLTGMTMVAISGARRQSFYS